MKYPYIATSSTVALNVDGKQLSVDRTHANFVEIRRLVDTNDHTRIPELLDVSLAISKVPDFSIGFVESDGDVVLYKGEALDTSLTKRIIQLHQSGESITKMVAFLTNLMENPSSTAVSELYDFLSYGDSPLTDDGYFLAYKNVRSDYMDIYSNTMDNSVGKVVKMSRYAVDDNRNSTCSNGLHFCSKDYLSNYFSSNNGRTIIVKIHPKDVVAIPADYGYTKGRCCEYEVLSDLHDFHKDAVFSKGVIDSDKVKLTLRQNIALKTINRVLIGVGFPQGVNDDGVDLMTMYDDNRPLYESIIGALEVAFETKITRDRAVKHYKFVKRYIATLA